MVSKLLVANRGEIAIRIMATASDLGIETVAVYATDDASAPHVAAADVALPLVGEGPAGYLNIEAIVAAATSAGADAVHPGYGFLAERSELALACEAAGLMFVGPTPETLALFGDKTRARAHARSLDVPVPLGTEGSTTPEEAEQFLASLGPGAAIMVKALAGGGGRGMRPVYDAQDLKTAWATCVSEALKAFDNDALYVEQLLTGARHIEVQVVGDGRGAVRVLGDRECSVQRMRQKLLEIAPAPAVDPTVRTQLHSYAQTLAEAVEFRSLGTMEFLVIGADHPEAQIVFLETNARIQVEHTVTEEVFGVDLVHRQLLVAAGDAEALDGLTGGPVGYAVQARVNLERVHGDGSVSPTAGTATTFEAPSGPGIRVDTDGSVGHTTNPRYDSLLAKVVAHSPAPDPHAALRKLARALDQFRIEGVQTNVELMRVLAATGEVVEGNVDTAWLESNLGRIVDQAGAPDPHLDDDDGGGVTAKLAGTVLSVDVVVGDEVWQGQQLAVIEAMKMEHLVLAAVSGVVLSVQTSVGAMVHERDVLVVIDPADVGAAAPVDTDTADSNAIRPELQEVIDRHEVGLDHSRPGAVEKRRKTGQRTARENVADLVDAGSYVEYGALVVAPQRKRRSMDDLMANTPADGMVGGLARVNGALFDEDKSRCVVMSYDYTVLAGTQGGQNHRKKDRLFELAQRWRLPVLFFTEGGGGRPGDTDGMGVAGLDCLAFGLWAELSGLVPLVGINSGYCFAGNAAILGCCDVIIATENSNIGMGGPAMIEGGGLGSFAPTEVGPMSVQRPNGVVDIAVSDEAEAVAVAKKYLAYFQGPLHSWDAPDQEALRNVIPENRLRVYDVRSVIQTMFDTDSVLELRRDFGLGMVTALARVEGRPVGVLANVPEHLAGAIDSDAADKAARFMQLCDAFDLPIVQLCDTPGFMVGPKAEQTGLVRHVSRMFVTARSVTVPTCTIVLRKGYGLGAMAMASGGFKFGMFTVAWPTAEFGGMGLEGAVQLGYRKELEAVEDPDERKALYDRLVDKMYEVGKGLSMADHFEIDDVIDPVDSRRWISSAFGSVPLPLPRTTKKRPMIDPW